MRLPQVSERIKEAPAQVLRGVFAGIGQLLLITDKLRNKPPFGQQAPPARVPERAHAPAPRTEPAHTVTDSAADTAPAERDAAAEPAADQAQQTPRSPKASRTPKTPRSTSAPRTPKIPAAPQTPKTPPTANQARDLDRTGNVRLLTGGEAAAEPAAAEPSSAPVAAAEQAAPASPAEPAGAPADAGPPLPNYGELSIASLRARLRNLDVTQVRGLLKYEQAHAARADVIVMFERRIAKLEADG